MQRLAGDELFSDLAFERDAMGTMLGHGFYSPEARQEGSNQRPQTVHPQGRTPLPGNFSMLIDRLASKGCRNAREAQALRIVRFVAFPLN